MNTSILQEIVLLSLRGVLVSSRLFSSDHRSLTIIASADSDNT